MAAPPVDPARSRRTSAFGTRIGRTSGQPTFHAGLDFRGSRGDPVFAADGGEIEYIGREADQARRTRGYGNVIAIRHDDGTRTVYAHLNHVYPILGQRVGPGKLIGTVGNTTNGKFPRMGSHLHFEVRRPARDGSAPFPGPYRALNIDPEQWLSERGVQLARNGTITLDTARGGQAPASGPTLSGLGINDAGLDLSAEGLPDEPLRDPWTFEPTSPIFIASVVAMGAFIVVVGAFTIFRDVRIVA
ncbi:MAG: M23 family metallopeptidase [bacterium]|nr:M23 family metallopeptidase [bacterium]